MILNLLHDRHSLAEVACIKGAIEDRYGPYGVQVHDRGYFYVPSKGPKLDASVLLRHMKGVLGQEMCLWIVDEEMFYPGKGSVFGCSTGMSTFRVPESTNQFWPKRPSTRLGMS